MRPERSTHPCRVEQACVHTCFLSCWQYSRHASTHRGMLRKVGSLYGGSLYAEAPAVHAPRQTDTMVTDIHIHIRPCWLIRLQIHACTLYTDTHIESCWVSSALECPCLYSALAKSGWPMELSNWAALMNTCSPTADSVPSLHRHSLSRARALSLACLSLTVSTERGWRSVEEGGVLGRHAGACVGQACSATRP
jgi:hypothetical protein